MGRYKLWVSVNWVIEFLVGVFKIGSTSLKGKFHTFNLKRLKRESENSKF